MTQRTWHEGPPPHVGWWNASTNMAEESWRWWNGSTWSHAALPHYTAEDASKYGLQTKGFLTCEIQWTHNWPVNGRVPRINPSNGEVTGAIKHIPLTPMIDTIPNPPLGALGGEAEPATKLPFNARDRAAVLFVKEAIKHNRHLCNNRQFAAWVKAFGIEIINTVLKEEGL